MTRRYKYSLIHSKFLLFIVINSTGDVIAMSPRARTLLTSLPWPAQPTNRWWPLETTSAVSSGEKGGWMHRYMVLIGMVVPHNQERGSYSNVVTLG